jgi:hypothetical protein
MNNRSARVSDPAETADRRSLGPVLLQPLTSLMPHNLHDED